MTKRSALIPLTTGTCPLPRATDLRSKSVRLGLVRTPNPEHALSRLVLVEVTPTGGAASTRAAYGYYGTHWRAWRVADNNADTAIDQANTYYYDASWRLLEERIDEGHTPDSGWLAAAPPRRAQSPPTASPSVSGVSSTSTS